MARIAVVDVETTGLNPFRHDRVIEVAVVLIDETGTVIRELNTLVNPERDIGASRIHGLTGRDLLGAPRFRDVAAPLVEILDGCVAVAGHNIRFDQSFLAAEFERIGYSLPELPSLCTMHLAGGGNLADACTAYGAAFDGEAHAALHDARAAAHLLTILLEDAPQLAARVFRLPALIWRPIPATSVPLLSRAESRNRQQVAPTYVQRLLGRVQPDLPPSEEESAVLAYAALLDRVLLDRHVTAEEGEALVEVATKWSMSGDLIQKVHRHYLIRLAAAALADGNMTESERRDFRQVGHWLGFSPPELDSILVEGLHTVSRGQVAVTAPGPAASVEGLAGKCVCFTGESTCRTKGSVITRETAMDLAARHGLVVTESVTKKLDLLVVADPLSQSGKAKKARQYGIPIMHELVFWRALGVEVQ